VKLKPLEFVHVKRSVVAELNTLGGQVGGDKGILPKLLARVAAAEKVRG
jgi:hypothetical protein